MSTRSDQRKDAAEHGLYDPAYEHDACGVGFVASVKPVFDTKITGSP